VTVGVRNGLIPTVGNNVTIYTNAIVSGGITLNDNCIVGAQSYCDSSVGENCFVAGVPAKLMSDSNDTPNDN
jgi:serine O-acetyltransferase